MPEGISPHDCFVGLYRKADQFTYQPTATVYLFGIDTTNPSLYDMVLHVRILTTDDIVDVICHTVGLPHFQTTTESQNSLEVLLLACEVKVAILDIKPNIDVSARDGIVLVKTKTRVSQEDHLVHQIREVGMSIPGVKKISVNFSSQKDLD